MKREVRILGVDDCPFEKGQRYVQIIGVVFRGGQYLDGLLSCRIAVDGFNSTKKLIEMINKSRNKGQLRYIMLDGIALGGFNIVDIQKLWAETGLPVVVIMRKRPNFAKIKAALKNLSSPARRWTLIQKAGQIYETEVWNNQLRKKGKVYFQIAGLKAQLAAKLIRQTTVHGAIPEPIRVAHLIATGLGLGESRGRA